jgi:hypothetical protein
MNKTQKYGLAFFVLLFLIFSFMSIAYYMKPRICRGTNKWYTTMKMTYTTKEYDDYTNTAPINTDLITLTTKSTSSLFECDSFTFKEDKDNHATKADIKNKVGTLSYVSPSGTTTIFKSFDISAEPIVWVAKIKPAVGDMTVVGDITTTWTWNIDN